MGLTIFFDESYDQPKKAFTVLGALLVESRSNLLKGLRGSKVRHGFVQPDGVLKELKYTGCIDATCLKVAKDAVDLFLPDGCSRFACIVIEERLLDRRRFGKIYEPEKIVNARIYKKFAELLLKQNLRGETGAVLLTDSMTRCQGDRFLELLKGLFSLPQEGYSKDSLAPVLRHIQEVPSHADQYQVLQICDLLCGCVLNQNVPAARRKSRKNRIRRYLCERLGVRDLSRSLWIAAGAVPRGKRQKFNVWYWEPRGP